MRLLLATAVFIGHEGPVAGLKLVPADLAVQAFFVISGFYMALILDSKYRGATKVFLINRFTKIYSMYFAVLIGCLVAMIYFGTTFYMSSRQFMKFLGDAPFTTALSYVAANLGIFGLDALMFFNLKSDGQLCSILTCQGYGAHLFMLIPQAWSLSLELLFYLMAPFILRKSSSLLIAIVSAILVLRLVLWLNFPFIGGDPWSYRFFPFELATFLLGSLAYRFYRHEYFHRIQKFSFVAVFVVLFASFGYNELFGGYGKPLYVFIFWLCTPFLFSTSKSWKWDRLIGEWSYPIYLSHLLVIQVVRNTKMVDPGSPTKIYVLVLIFSGVLLLCERPLERWRQSRIRPERGRRS